jgi:FkbM family methyltransferase
MQLISYAQNFEDVMLWRALKNVKNGFYVDVGAAWPDTDSVTKLFYDKGWFGINIEPNPEFYVRLCEQRPKDINLRIAVCERNGEGNLNLFSDTGLSTLETEVAKEHIKNKFNCVSINVTTATLSSLFQKYLSKKQEIHFLKIDVEGLEGAVLASNNWLLYRPWIVVVESTLPSSQVESHHIWEPQLLAASYTFAYKDGLNRFYIENQHLDLLVFFKYPPNVFDGFVLASSQIALSNELTSMIKSRSWKLTKPLRQCSIYARHLREFVRIILIKIVHIRPRVLFVRTLKSIKVLIERKPVIRKFFLMILNKFPRMKLTLSNAFMFETRNSTKKSATPKIDDSLSFKRIEKIVAKVLDDVRNQK